LGVATIAPSQKRTRGIILGLVVADAVNAAVSVWHHFTVGMFAVRFIEGLFIALLLLPILLAVGQIVEDRQAARDGDHLPPAA
jgi:hypothetical protein